MRDVELGDGPGARLGLIVAADARQLADAEISRLESLQNAGAEPSRRFRTGPQQCPDGFRTERDHATAQVLGQALGRHPRASLRGPRCDKARARASPPGRWRRLAARRQGAPRSAGPPPEVPAHRPSETRRPRRDPRRCRRSAAWRTRRCRQPAGPDWPTGPDGPYRQGRAIGPGGGERRRQKLGRLLGLAVEVADRLPVEGLDFRRKYLREQGAQEFRARHLASGPVRGCQDRERPVERVAARLRRRQFSGLPGEWSQTRRNCPPHTRPGVPQTKSDHRQ